MEVNVLCLYECIYGTNNYQEIAVLSDTRQVDLQEFWLAAVINRIKAPVIGFDTTDTEYQWQSQPGICNGYTVKH